MDNRQKGKTPLRKDDLHLFLRSGCDVRLEAPHGSNMVVGGKIQENKIHDQQKWLSAAIQARLTTSRQSPS